MAMWTAPDGRVFDLDHPVDLQLATAAGYVPPRTPPTGEFDPTYGGTVRPWSPVERPYQQPYYPPTTNPYVDPTTQTPIEPRTPVDPTAEFGLLFPWLPGPLLDAFLEGYTEYGDANLAYAFMQQQPEYEQYFPGNQRDDGSFRWSEAEYSSYKERFAFAITSIGVNPTYFMDKFPGLIEAGVTPDEFEQRVDQIYERVISRSPEIRQYYAQNFGLDLTDAAILAASLDPTVGAQVINRQIDIASIGAEAAMRNYNIDWNLAERITNRGLSAGQAGEVFSQAVENLPILDVLARRHNDPDDTFDLNEFLSASIFDDPNERRRIRRLLSQEASMFSPSTGFATQGRAVTGLRPI